MSGPDRADHMDPSGPDDLAERVWQFSWVQRRSAREPVWLDGFPEVERGWLVGGVAWAAAMGLTHQGPAADLAIRTGRWSVTMSITAAARTEDHCHERRVDDSRVLV